MLDMLDGEEEAEWGRDGGGGGVRNPGSERTAVGNRKRVCLLVNNTWMRVGRCSQKC